MRRGIQAERATRLLALGMFLAIAPGIAHAKAMSSFFGDHARGWFWYEEPPARPEKPKDEIKDYPFPPETLKEARKQLEDLKERAVMHPTEENLVAYIRLQNWVNDKSEDFAHAWQRALWMHPGLDYSIGHPTDSRALLIRRDVEDARHGVQLKDIAGRYGMIFVFRSTCPYCHAEAPMLKRFAHRYGFSVIPVSQDGPGLPDYPRPEADHGISAQFGIHAVPALFLVNPRRREVFPVAYGLVGESELTRRIIAIVHAREGAHR